MEMACKVEGVLDKARRRVDATGIVERAATQIQRVLDAQTLHQLLLTV